MDEYAAELHPHQHVHAQDGNQDGHEQDAINHEAHEMDAQKHDSQQPDESAQNDPSYSTDDLDLENAIGDAFKHFAMLNEASGPSLHEQPIFNEPAPALAESKPESESEPDLEAVVGSVFGSLAQSDLSPHDSPKPSASDSDYQSDHLLPQAEAGSEAKKSQIDQLNETDPKISEFSSEVPANQEIHHDLSSGSTEHTGEAGEDPSSVGAEMKQDEPEMNNTQEKATTDETTDPDANTDLEAAIGNAFKSLSNPTANEGLALEDTFDIKKEDHEQNLEDAIGEVFQNLAKSDKPLEVQPEPEPKHASEPGPALSSDEILRQAISQSLNSIYDMKKEDEASSEAGKNHVQSEAAKDSTGLNLAGIVQDVVERINSNDSIPEGLQKRRQSFIDELAGEISHKVSNSETGASGSKDIPVLDENVLAHFQTVAHKEDSQTLDSAIKSAVANAVNTATSQAPSKAQVASAENESDLEKLHMNEILQNAFNMAMSNPQELITSLDIDESQTSISKTSSSETYREQPNALSTAAAIAALSVKDALARKDDSAKTEPKGEKPIGKPLSIAQTLALHRASMAGPAKRDYSAIQTLEDSMKPEPASSVQMNPQLSNILSSLSHHIQSGTQSQNLMSVIRQMTNALMLTKTSICATKRVQEIVQELKKSPESEKRCLEDLKEGKQFLVCSIDDSQRAQTLLTSIIGYIKPQEKAMAESKTEEEFSQMQNEKQLKEFYDCAHTAISSYNSTRFRAALVGVKRDVDSSEYKERVRIENRERKKKWREENAERNKDNDLRARVLRRAAYMFGEGNSQEKTLWMEDEFSKRREKRFARQQKEESADNGSSDSNESKSKTVSLYNPKLSGMLGKYIHLVGEGGSEMTSDAASAATCAVIAVGVWRYSNEIGVKDTKQILSTITQVINTTLDGSIRSGDYMQLPFLVKAETTDKNKELKEKYTAMMEQRNSASAGEALHIREAQKRAYGGNLEDAKRKKTDDGFFAKSDLESHPRPSNPNAPWSSANGLKMPHYRKPLGNNDVPQPNEQDRTPLAQTKSALSPFISNKVGKDSAITTPSGLRKPGSFQRPAYARSSKSSGGFSALYSTSFKHN